MGSYRDLGQDLRAVRHRSRESGPLASFWHAAWPMGRSPAAFHGTPVSQLGGSPEWLVQPSPALIPKRIVRQQAFRVVAPIDHATLDRRPTHEDYGACEEGRGEGTNAGGPLGDPMIWIITAASTHHIDRGLPHWLQIAIGVGFFLGVNLVWLIPVIIHNIYKGRKERQFSERVRRNVAAMPYRGTVPQESEADRFERTMRDHEIWLKNQADLERKAQRGREAGERFFKYLGGGD